MKLKSNKRKTLAAIQRAVKFGLPVASLLTIASCGPATHDDQKTVLEDKRLDKKNNSIREICPVEEGTVRFTGDVREDAFQAK